jgi:hypothetical protein
MLATTLTYVQRIERDVGANITFCGEVSHREHDLEANACLVDAFMGIKGAYVLTDLNCNRRRVNDSRDTQMTDEKGGVFFYLIELPSTTGNPAQKVRWIKYLPKPRWP